MDTNTNKQLQIENKNTNKNTHDKDDGIERRQTRSMDKALQKEKEMEESVAMFGMKMDILESFDDIAIYSVEMPTKEQNTLEVKEAKAKEVENLVKYVVFEEVNDCGEERIGSR